MPPAPGTRTNVLIRPSSSPVSVSAIVTSRALVLGGGGSAGNAWEIGVVAGLADAGVDVTDADLIVGTSAGATVAVQVTSALAAQLLAAILTAPVPAERRPAPVTPVVDHLERTNRIIAAAL